jgi:hypothetical protein
VVRRFQGEVARSVQFLEEAQVNGFSNNSYRGYQTLEEADKEFNQFLTNEAMDY